MFRPEWRVDEGLADHIADLQTAWRRTWGRLPFSSPFANDW
jgi:hypothetical protein